MLLLALAGAVQAAGVRDEVGHTRLAAELGERLPRGEGLRIVQVESAMAIDHDGDEATPPIMAWAPGSHRELKRVPVVDHSASSVKLPAHSKHATWVARRLVGSRVGLATDVAGLEVYSTSHWLGGILRVGRPLQPRAVSARVANHSWAADLGADRNDRLDADVLRRVDWLAERDELITVAGIRNAVDRVNVPLLSAARNALIVGRANGRHSRSTPALDSTYTAGRSRPHIVAPGATSSAATPVVASAMLLLTELALDPSLSTRREAATTRAALEVYDAGRVETLRAIVMAAARWPEGVEPDTGANGLDERFGAGQLDLYAAARLLLGGEQEASDPDLPESGFDYVAGLAPNTSRTYRLDTDERCRLRATLVWNMQFPGVEARRFDASAVLNDLDLLLNNLGVGRAMIVSSSRSENTEHLTRTLPAGRYALEVQSRGPEPQDYALAWHCDTADAKP